MARQIGPIVEALMRRVRQEGGLAVTPDFATQMYSRCEQVTNAFTRRVLASTTLSTPKEKLVFHFRDEITDAIDIVSVRDASTGRRVEYASTLAALSAYDIDWFRKVDGTRFEVWAQLARDILILYPGQAAASSVSVEYVKLLTYRDDFDVDYNQDSELPEEDIEFALRLAEIVLLARLRQLPTANALIKTFVGSMQ